MPDDLLRLMSVTTPRDRTLLRWLVDHRVLTTGQITAALFNSPVTARHRLALLRRRGLTDRWRWHHGTGGSSAYHHVIGPLGARIIAAERDKAPPSAQRLRDQRTQLATSANLGHLLGVNDFFTQLAAHARTHPPAALVTWHNTAQAVSTHSVFNDAPARPDGYGEWRDGHRTVRFFLEHDTGTMNLGDLADKLDTYHRAVRRGWPTHPVLFWLPSTRRAANLRQLLTRTAPHPVPIWIAATGPNPAEAMWVQPGRSAAPRRLSELPTPLL